MQYEEIVEALTKIYEKGAMDAREHPELPIAFLIPKRDKEIRDIVDRICFPS